jgi:hypothetical protein
MRFRERSAQYGTSMRSISLNNLLKSGLLATKHKVLSRKQKKSQLCNYLWFTVNKELQY